VPKVLNAFFPTCVEFGIHFALLGTMDPQDFPVLKGHHMDSHESALPTQPQPPLNKTIIDGAEPTDKQRELQNVLPEVEKLSQKVGGIDNLADIVDSIKSLK
jgi:hypothetical protein